MPQKSIQTLSDKETERAGEELAKKLAGSRVAPLGAVVVALTGELGAGKTTFAKGFARGLGIPGNIQSPTFLIVKPYKIPDTSYKIQTFTHVDCWRLHDPQELKELGWDKIVQNPGNIVLVEWAERVEELLPTDTTWISFSNQGKGKRKIVLQ